MKAGVFLFALSVFVLSGCSRGTPQAGNNFNYLFNNGHHSIETKDGQVIITNDEGHQAVITQDGTLAIENKSIAVVPKVKDNLAQYVETTQQMEKEGLTIAKHAGGFAAGIVGDVFSGLFNGKSEKDIEQKANQSAAEFKKTVLPICISAQKLEHLQDAIAADVPAFKQYAVIQDKDVTDCQQRLSGND
ncbi:MAG: hypothetical protein ACRETA_00240 [Gammaproteobacteria bacterium]